ncbi:MAG: glycosyltransferase family 4 protein [Prevotellaceae bacterium]|jgi:glycosyltransferase involved in cell wall biosynthesis|nr:glycosyltransferase family 4 protein [Prevotellaceae bacterium]
MVDAQHTGIKVAFDGERMKNRFTGLYEYCRLLGQSLIDVKNSYDNLLYYVPADYVGFFGNNVDYSAYKPTHKLFFQKFKAVNVWHMTHQLTSYAPNSKQIKKVLTIHDLNFLYEKKSEDKIKKYLKLCQKNIDRCDHIVAISEYAKQDILKYLKVNNKPITVIYNGCKIKEFPEYVTPKYQPQQPFLFSIGVVLPKKNFHVLPSLLVDNSYELLVAGNAKSDYHLKILDEAEKFGVKNRVKILGAITDEDRYWYFKNCTAFLFPSLAEGFGIPVIEAMHFGKPVFLSTKTSLPEIGGNHAFYFNSFDLDQMRDTFEKGMQQYLETNPMRQVIEYANRFDWEVSAKKYWEVYQSLVE